ncbi:MAG: hypothetical protein IJI10_11670 [Eubacterium sp.]|nr:hypothetical protein [Eubacterium sp.]
MRYCLKTVLLTLVLSCAVLNGCGQSSSDAALNTEPSAVSAVSERETETASSASERETDAASSASEPETEAETLYASSQPVADSPEWVTKLDAAKDAEQLIVVAGVDKTTAYVTMHEKDAEGTWKQLIATPGFIGLDGLGDANINDCYTPVGTFTIDKAFGIADDPGCQMEYTKVDDTYYWSGDPREGMHFNELVSIKDVPDLDTENSEHITDFDYAYQYVLNMGYNSECEYEKGFAFFLHCFRMNRTYTGGCVGVPENIMKYIMQHVKPGCKITIDSLVNFGGDLDA